MVVVGSLKRSLNRLIRVTIKFLFAFIYFSIYLFLKTKMRSVGVYIDNITLGIDTDCVINSKFLDFILFSVNPFLDLKSNKQTQQYYGLHKSRESRLSFIIYFHRKID